MRLHREYYADNYETVTTTAIETADRPAQVRVREIHTELPQAVFAAIIDPDQPNAERVMVTQVSADNYTVEPEPGQRPYTHAAGAIFRHALTARSLTQPMRDHLDLEDPHGQYIRERVFQRVGDLLVGLKRGFTVLPRHVDDGMVLATDSTRPSGLSWQALSSLMVHGVEAIGDLMVGGVHEGVLKPVRLAAGELLSVLLLEPSEPLLSDPTTPPWATENVSPLRAPTQFIPRTVYWFSYSWGNEHGWTALSPGLSWLSPTAPTPIELVFPAAPAGVTAMRIWVAATGPDVQPATNDYLLAAEFAAPDTAATNHATMTGSVDQTEIHAPEVNTTGARVPKWRRLLADDGDLLTVLSGDFARITRPTSDGRTYVLTSGSSIPGWTPSTLAPLFATLDRDILIEQPDTFVDGPSIDLPPGDWLIVGKVQCSNPDSGSPFSAALWAPGQTALDSAEAWSGAPDQSVSLTVFASVHLTELTTLKISIASTLPGGLIRANTATRNLGPTASRIVAFPGRL